jgi:Tfp pilus assembly protein PilX
MLTKRRCSWRSNDATYRNERGVVLTTSLIVLAVLSLMGATAILTTITDTQIASNLKNNARAFYYAEAGIHYTLAKLPDLIADDSLSLTGSLPDETLADPITAPANFSFDPIDTFTRVGNSKTYQFQVTGRAGTSRVTLRVDFRRVGSSVTYGLFGNQTVELQESSQVFSYDSDVTPNPTALDATGEGDVGSNEEVQIHHTVYIDGHVSLGTDELGNPGSYSITGDPTDNPSVTGGWPPANVDRVNPDPLGAINGDLADEIVLLSNNNDNLKRASPPIKGNTINLSAGDPPMTLRAGNYYLTSVTLNAFSELKIDTTSGAVNIYLAGAFNAMQYSSITYTSAMVLPSDFTIYSNASAPIVLSHSDAFKGMIYAPYASVEIKNGGGFTPSTVYGLIWANSGTLYGPGLFYFDTKLKSKLVTNAVSIVSWKEVIN